MTYVWFLFISRNVVIFTIWFPFLLPQVSNHGARQLDTTPATIEVLGEIVAAVRNSASSVEVYLDGGIMRGTDVLKVPVVSCLHVSVANGAVCGFRSVHACENILLFGHAISVDTPCSPLCIDCLTGRGAGRTRGVHRPSCAVGSGPQRRRRRGQSVNLAQR